MVLIEIHSEALACINKIQPEMILHLRLVRTIWNIAKEQFICHPHLKIGEGRGETKNFLPRGV